MVENNRIVAVVTVVVVVEEYNRIVAAVVVVVEYNRTVVNEAYINVEHHTHFVVVAILVYSFQISVCLNHFLYSLLTSNKVSYDNVFSFKIDLLSRV